MFHSKAFNLNTPMMPKQVQYKRFNLRDALKMLYRQELSLTQI